MEELQQEDEFKQLSVGHDVKLKKDKIGCGDNWLKIACNQKLG